MNTEISQVSKQVANDHQHMAELTAAAMFASDAATRGLDMQIVHVAEGTATLSMRIRPAMLNGHQTCHGGYLFTLADSAFAFACNSRNQVTVAAGCSIEYLLPGREADVITATVTEQSLTGRTGIYDARLTNQHGQLIALFRGKSHKLNAEVVPGLVLRENAVPT
ncbi:hydroxyphenylacetyl-CoA thioesterase PaaI [Undibacterium sp. Ji50W]|uniref:hydroxyphenylacetyl-CoA thioesterase PaaI n=1 Tax=Undibacterium sp. Ji50W TaxID=3413041 RepID=UPI003BF0437D